MLWLNISRLNLLYILIEVIIYGIVGPPYISASFIVFILIAYLSVLLFESSFFFYFYLKVRELESVWDNSSIHKLNMEKKSWSKTQIRRLKVGDLVLLKRNTVAPADLLIIDTSDNHFSDQILYTNERRVTGQNIMTTKRAIKNLRGKNQSKNQYEVLKHILPALEGHIEYEAPSDNVIDFTGYFKLNNDPQISKISHKNVLFCGTQLHTSWMIGMVLFTGQNTKILQMNLSKINKFERIIKEIKISRTSMLINKIMLVYLIFGLLITAVYYTVEGFRESAKEQHWLVMRFVLGSASGFANFLLVWQGPLTFVPQLSVMVYEICCFIFGLRIQRRSHRDRLARIEAANKAIKEVSVYQGRKASRKKSSKLTSIDSFNDSNRHSSSNEGEGSNRLIANSFGKGRRNNIQGTVNNSGINTNQGARGLRRGNSLAPASKTHMKRRSLTGIAEAIEFTKDEAEVRVINYEALPTLGAITHVVFDKTDTLTMSTMHVCQLTTVEKIYKVDNENRLKELMDLYDSNPQAFEFEEDIEENKAQENSYYSEKSQE
jgi:magnesium-transporting ATPase (P-type)